MPRVAAGIEEGGFQDRAILGLPGRQEEMINRISSTGVPVVVVLIGGSAITMSEWMDNVNGIVEAWYPGDMGGYAVADVLRLKTRVKDRGMRLFNCI
ncbi:MAG: glycoside hydrolase family 3 C-terminal domain-containing protein [Bacteroidales bacterium]|nr:glycoside hydrolase family 3 C-terminal domain-containing protein [Bacteroidales bacterium]